MEEVKVVTRNEGWISPQGLSSLVRKSDALRIRNDGFLIDSPFSSITAEGQSYVWGIL